MRNLLGVDKIVHVVVKTLPDIIKFTYYHCTSIDYSVLYEWMYFECTTQYNTLVLWYHIQIQGESTYYYDYSTK